MKVDREAARTEALRRMAKMLHGYGRNEMRKFGLDYGSVLGLKLVDGKVGETEIDGEGIKVPIEPEDEAVNVDAFVAARAAAQKGGFEE